MTFDITGQAESIETLAIGNCVGVETEEKSLLVSVLKWLTAVPNVTDKRKQASKKC